MELTAEQDAYLREHRLGVLGTGRRDGSPQLSLVQYHWDGSDLAISITSDRAKWANVKRQPRVSLLVQDGRRQLILYGTAEAVAADPARRELHARLRRLNGREVPPDDAFSRELDEAKRVAIRIRPERVLLNA